MERLVLLADDGRVSEDDLPEEMLVCSRGTGASANGGFHLPPGGMSWEDHELSCLSQALETANGNRAQAARLLDLPYKAFLYRLEKYALVEV